MTTQTLIQITLGPVQDFIIAARRTRDLAFGSHILSEISKAAAKALADGGSTLIFPALDKDDPRLDPRPDAIDPRGDATFNVSNIVLAYANDLDDAAISSLVAAARDAALNRWSSLADQIFTQAQRSGMLAPSLNGTPIQDVWSEQIHSLIELGAVWTTFDPHQEGSYKTARRNLASAQASRKNLRDFSQWTHAAGPVPKSSLDGVRASVLCITPTHHQLTALRNARIQASISSRDGTRSGEELDAIGLIKRLAGKDQGFVPLANIAYAPWLQALRVADSATLTRITSPLSQHRLSITSKSSAKVAPLLMIDAHALLTERHPSLNKELDDLSDTVWSQFKADLSTFIKGLPSKLREPKTPYVACLVADGDRMGKALDALTTPEAHRVASAALAAFAMEEARKIVEQRHFGQLVYAGGDDVLAFVALEDAISCAHELQEAFKRCAHDAFQEAFADLKEPPDIPTLSVGVGVGHVMESMGHLLSLGRAAEKDAKLERNALSIRFDKRSGDLLTWRSSWTKDPRDTIHKASSALRKQDISVGKLYELAKLLAAMPPAGSTLDDERDWVTLVRSDVRRVLARSDRSGQGDGKRAVALCTPIDDKSITTYHALITALRHWLTMMLLAHALNNAQQEVR